MMAKFLKDFGGKLVIKRGGVLKRHFVCYALLDGEMTKVHNDYLKDLLDTYGNRYYCTNGEFAFRWFPFPTPFKVRIFVENGRTLVGYDSNSDTFRMGEDVFRKFELKLITRVDEK